MSLVWRSLGRLYRSCWAALVVVLVLLALYTSLGRQYIVYVEDYSADLERFIQQRIAANLSIGQLSGDWQGLSPVLSVEDFHLSAGKDQPVAVALGEARFTVSVLSTLWRRQPELQQLSARELRVYLVENEQQRWQLRGFQSEGGELPSWLSDTLLALRQAELDTLEVHLQPWEGPATELRIDAARLDGNRSFRRLHGIISSGAGRSQMVMELDGHPDAAKGIGVKAYLQLDDAQFNDWLPFLPRAQRQALVDVPFSGRLWADWHERDSLNVEGELSAEDLSVAALVGLEDEQKAKARLRFALFQRDNNWALHFDRLQGAWLGQAADFSGLHLNGDLAAEALRIRMPSVNVAQMAELVMSTPGVPESTRRILTELKPTGLLQRLDVSLPLTKTEMDDFSLRGEFKQLTIEPWMGAPGVSGAEGFVEGGWREGVLTTHSPELALFFPKVYEAPLTLQDVQAQVSWQIENNKVMVNSGLIQARDGDASAGAILALDLPLERGQTPLMTLMVGMRDGGIAQRDKYIPYKLNPALQRWLRDSVQAADLSAGGFIYRGSLLAGDHDNRTVQLWLDIADGSLMFDPRWPPIRELQAQLLLDDSALSIEGQRGLIYQSTVLRNIEGHFDSAENEWLRLRGDAYAGAPDVLRLLTETSLRDQLGAGFDNWRAQGRLRGEIEIDVGLKSRQVKPKIQALMSDLILQPGDLGLEITELEGQLQFDEGALLARRLRGQVFDRPIEANIETGESGVITRISGRSDIADIRNWLQQPVLGFAEGETDWSMRVVAGRGQSYVHLESDLKGVLFDLPEPLFKPADRSNKLWMSMPLGAGEQRLELNIERVGHLSLLLGGQKGGIAFTLGDGRRVDLEPGILSVGGFVDSANAADWQSVWNRYQRISESMGTGEGSTAVRVSHLVIEQAELYGMSLSELIVSADNGDGSSDWWINFSSDRLDGHLMWPMADGMPELDLRRLALPALADLLPTKAVAETPAGAAAVNASDSPPDTGMDLSKLPSAQVNIAELSVDGEHWGNMRFDFMVDEDSLGFENVQGALRGVYAGAGRKPTRLRWYWDENEQRTLVQGLFAIPDVGNALKRWRYERMIEARDGELDLDIAWSGHPGQWSLNKLQGDIRFEAARGRLPSSPQGASDALRMVGIFNIANLIRRLQFDFSDVFESGIHFDDIDGGLRFNRGVMMLNPNLDIDGLSSQFTLTGMADFPADKVDMELVATLPIGSNLPWVAALVGGLPAAAGVYIASKVFEKQVDRFSSAVYGITGSWRDPQVKFKRIFDEGREPAAMRSQKAAVKKAPPKTTPPKTTPSKPQPEVEEQTQPASNAGQ